MSQQNMMLVRRAIRETWNRATALIDEFVAGDLVSHASTPDDEILGAGGVH